MDVNVFDDVIQNAKHRANDASSDLTHPPLVPGGHRGAILIKRLHPGTYFHHGEKK